jgi:hypothetical protein
VDCQVFRLHFIVLQLFPDRPFRSKAVENSRVILARLRSVHQGFLVDIAREVGQLDAN